MTTKKVFSATDAHPIVLHAKRDPDSEIAYPILVGVDGSLMVSQGLSSSNYDTILMTYSSGNLSTAIFQLLGATVYTLNLTYDGDGNLLTVVRT